MEFFNSAVDTLQTIVVGLGGALCVWGGINLLEGYGQDNPGSKSQGVKQLVAGGGAALYYFKFRKPKADTTGHDDLDEYDFGEDEDADEEPAEIEIHSENGQEDET